MPQVDLIRRFAGSPIEAMCGLSGACIRLETNCQAVADQVRRALDPCPACAFETPDFVFRVVAEPEADVEVEALPTVHRLSHDGLSFISLGRSSFLACDRKAGRGISFVSESFVTDEKQFSQRFLPALILLLRESIEPPL